MKTAHQAREIAIQSLASCEAESFETALLDEETQEVAEGWIFYYQSRRFLETGDISDSLVGNAPLFVPREADPPVFISYLRPVAESMEAYRACGNANAKAQPRVRLCSSRAGFSAALAIKAIRGHAEIGLADAKAAIEQCLAGIETTITTESVASARQLRADLEKHGFISVIGHDA